MKFIFTDRSEEKIDLIKQYLQATKQYRNYNDESQDPHYTEVKPKKNNKLTELFLLSVNSLVSLL